MQVGALWGSLVSCGRLEIGLVALATRRAAVTNQVTNHRAGFHPAPHLKKDYRPFVISPNTRSKLPPRNFRMRSSE